MGKRRVVLYGNSIIVGSIGASLKQAPQFEVISILPAQQSEMEDLEPDTVLFDLEAARPEVAFALLEKRPDMILVSVSPDSNIIGRCQDGNLQGLSALGFDEGN